MAAPLRRLALILKSQGSNDFPSILLLFSPKDALKTIKKRLKHKNTKVVLITLEVPPSLPFSSIRLGWFPSEDSFPPLSLPLLLLITSSFRRQLIPAGSAFTLSLSPGSSCLILSKSSRYVDLAFPTFTDSHTHPVTTSLKYPDPEHPQTNPGKDVGPDSAVGRRVCQ